MPTMTMDLPAMYGDHHVVEVRRILLELPGVEDVYASSAFRVVEVTYKKGQVTQKEINAKLEETGYLGDLPLAVEVGAVDVQNGDVKPFFRHSALYEQTQQSVSFAQVVGHQGRPLWPCPGIGPLKAVEE